MRACTVCPYKGDSMKHTHQTDIAIIGGGASGLAAALTAARHGAAVLLLEKLPRVGKKILATGNGCCNLGNLSKDMAHYGGGVDIASVLEQFVGEEAFFRALGLWVRADEEGRLYPQSNQATAVLDALRLTCAKLGVEEVCGFCVKEITPESDGFLLRSTNGQTVHARRVILATGGLAGSQYGSAGEGLKLARDLGHRVTDCRPALTPVPVDPRLVRSLKGLRVHAKVTALRDGKILCTEVGQVQFSEGALSGICVFNLSAYCPDVLELDLLPDCDDVSTLLTEICSSRAGFALEDMLTGLLPKRIGQVLLKLCTDLPQTARVSELDAIALTRLAKILKAWRFPARHPDNWEAAQVTAGGVTEVAPDLESTILPGLYFAGEILDVHGDCGGFNLRFAWASGVRAGEAAVRGLGL